MKMLYANDGPGEYPASYYAATSTGPFPSVPLAGDHNADVCVIGAGYTGLSAALHLAERGFKVIVLEAQRIGFGASGRNGGQLGSGQRLDPLELEAMMGPSKARMLWDLAEEAKDTAKTLIRTHNIACDLKPGIVSTVHRARYKSELRAYADHLETAYGYETTYLDREALQGVVPSPDYHAGVLDMGAAHLHPLNYALGLGQAAMSAGAAVHERSEVISVEKGAKPLVRTAKGSVRASHVILAANGYLGGLEPEVAARVAPINNFIIATEPLGEDGAAATLPTDIAVADSRFVVNYFRLSADKRMLFGGAESYGRRFPKDIAKLVRPRMLAVYPHLKDARIDYAWGGTLGITVNRMPHLTRLGPSILSASGYSGHGVALSTLAGKLAAEAVAGQAERFDAMAAVPTHRFPGGARLQAPLLALAMAWYALRDRL